jgi:hypothetical protein
MRSKLLGADFQDWRMYSARFRMRSQPLLTWGVCAGYLLWLLVLTRHVCVPVHERTVGVIAPCPNMEFKQPR